MKPYFSISIQTELIKNEENAKSPKILSVAIVFDNGNEIDVEKLPYLYFYLSDGKLINGNTLEEHESLVKSINSYTHKFYPSYKFVSGKEVSVGYGSYGVTSLAIYDFIREIKQEYDLGNMVSLAGNCIDSFVLPTLKDNKVFNRNDINENGKRLFNIRSLEVSSMEYSQEKDDFLKFDDLLVKYCDFNWDEKILKDGFLCFPEEMRKKRYNSLSNARNIVKIIRAISAK